MLGLRFKIPFSSFLGTEYVIDIYKEGYTGSYDILTGANDPIVTQEAGSDDLFLPIREQTGYINVIVDSQTTVDELIPDNDLSHFVRLIEVSSGNVKWQGFMKPQAFTQPYNEYRWKMSFPIQSLLAVLRGIHINPICRNFTVLSFDYVYLEDFFIKAFDSIFGENLQTITSPYILNYAIGMGEYKYVPVNNEKTYPAYPSPDPTVNTQTLTGGWKGYCLSINNLFFEVNSTTSKQRITYEYEIENAYEILNKIARFFGLMVRESGNTIYFLRNHQSTAGEWRWIDDHMVWVGPPRIVDVVDSVDNNNKVSKIMPVKKISINCRLKDEDSLFWYFTYPKTLINQSDVYNTPHALTGPAKKYQYQNPEGRALSSETYLYYSFFKTAIAQDVYRYMFEASDFQTMYQETLGGESQNYAGSFPCVYMPFDGNEMESALGCMLPNTADFESNQSEYFYACRFVVPENCPFINIYMELYWYENYPFGETTAIDIEILNNGEYSTDSILEPSGWTSTPHRYRITFVKGVIQTNMSTSVNSGPSGYYVRTNGRSGEFELRIAGFYYSNSFFAYGVFLFNTLKIGGCNKTSVVGIYNFEMDNDENIYEGINDNAISGKKNVELNIATNNSNHLCSSFLTAKSGQSGTTHQYVDKIKYGNTFERPEENLLRHMMKYYNEVRQIIRIKSRPFLDPTKHYEKNGRYYVGIDYKHEWADDAQEVKFIEVIQPEPESES